MSSAIPETRPRERIRARFTHHPGGGLEDEVVELVPTDGRTPAHRVGSTRLNAIQQPLYNSTLDIQDVHRDHGTDTGRRPRPITAREDRRTSRTIGLGWRVTVRPSPRGPREAPSHRIAARSRAAADDERGQFDAGPHAEFRQGV